MSLKMNSIVFLAIIALVNANNYYDFSDADYREVEHSRNFTGKVVLVTGSSSGIGEGIVKLFSLLGAKVVVTGRNITEIQHVGEEVQKLSPEKLKPLEIVADLTKIDDLNRLLNETINKFGKLDVLVQNAGIGSMATLKDKDFMEGYDRIFNTDLRAVIQLNKLSVPYLEITNGSIIHISSIAALAPSPLGLDYSMAKAAMDMMTKVMAIELGPYIRVNTINPGTILTEGFKESTNPIIVKIRENALKETPLKRLGEPLDVAKGVVFLASSDAAFITGANVVIDGGLHYVFSQT